MYSRGCPALLQRFSPVAVLLQCFFKGGIIRIPAGISLPCGFKIGIVRHKAPSPLHIPGFPSVAGIDQYRPTPEFTAEPGPGLEDGAGEATLILLPEERAPGRIPRTPDEKRSRCCGWTATGSSSPVIVIRQ